MKEFSYVLIFVLISGACTGCMTVNEAVRGPSETVGAVVAVPQAITQGVTSGYIKQTGNTQSNPYGR